MGAPHHPPSPNPRSFPGRKGKGRLQTGFQAYPADPAWDPSPDPPKFGTQSSAFSPVAASVVIWRHVSYLTALCLSFPHCEMRMVVVPPSWGGREG